MQFANVGGLRVEAAPELKAICPGCGSEVIAKCGEVKIRHWAHKGERNCDHWWEPETPWHRDWKNKFPEEMREIRCVADSGEVHIADIKNPAGLVIEFQHSSITPEERRSREAYYRNMVWVVDGMRLKKDHSRFEKGCSTLSKIIDGYFATNFPAECFPRNWIDCHAPVVFDFGVDKTLSCLLPERAEGRAVVLAISRVQFVEVMHVKSELLDHRLVLSTLAEGYRAKDKARKLRSGFR